MKIIVAAGLCAMVAACAGTCYAGAWTMPQGVFYDRLSLNHYRADQQFDGSGGREAMEDRGSYRDYNLANYLEYGVTDSVSLVNSLYYKRIRKAEVGVKRVTWGVGDIDVAAKVKLAEGDAGVVSLQGLVKIPEAYDAHRELPLGNGQWDFEARALYGKSLWPLFPGYCNFEIGYRWRLDAPSDEFRYLVEIGGDFSKSLYGRLKLDGILSMNDGSRFDHTGNPTTTNNFDLGKLEVTAGYRITERLSLEAAYTPALYGRDTAAGASYTLALAYRNR